MLSPQSRSTASSSEHKALFVYGRYAVMEAVVDENMEVHRELPHGHGAACVRANLEEEQRADGLSCALV